MWFFLALSHMMVSVTHMHISTWQHGWFSGNRKDEQLLKTFVKVFKVVVSALLGGC